jgi:hypothetical protein
VAGVGAPVTSPASGPDPRGSAAGVAAVGWYLLAPLQPAHHRTKSQSQQPLPERVISLKEHCCGRHHCPYRQPQRTTEGHKRPVRYGTTLNPPNESRIAVRFHPPNKTSRRLLRRNAGSYRSHFLSAAANTCFCGICGSLASGISAGQATCPYCVILWGTMSAAKRARPGPTVRRIRVAAVMIVLSILAGCSSVPIPPTYTEDELKTICERQGGWWRPDGLVGGYCERR